MDIGQQFARNAIKEKVHRSLYIIYIYLYVHMYIDILRLRYMHPSMFIYLSIYLSIDRSVYLYSIYLLYREPLNDPSS